MLRGWLIGGAVAGWAAAGLTFWLWLESRDNLAAQVERCNTDKAVAVAEAEKVVRDALSDAYEARLAQERLIQSQTRKALRTAQDAAREALSRPPEVREVIRRIADVEACMRAPVPAAVIDRL